MDDPALERDRHLRALDALARIDRISFGAARLWMEVSELHERLGRTVRVLDLACGGGDVLHGIDGRARRAGVPVELHGCDVSAVALERAWAGARAGRAVTFSRLDVVRGDLPEGYDLLTSSLFLHHLERGEASHLLSKMAAAARARVFVQDLRRTRLGYLFAWIGLRTLTRSDVARTDGLRSVEAAFTLPEVAELCAEAGLAEAVIRPVWPQRFVVRWSVA